MRSILIKENPLWKLPERRVARYLKRHLKARKNPTADDIDADEDEVTIFTTTSAAVNKEPALTKEEVVDKNVVKEEDKKEETVAEEDEKKETEAAATEPVSLIDKAITEEEEADVKTEEAGEPEKASDMIAEASEKLETEAYADDNDPATKETGACFGECIIS